MAPTPTNLIHRKVEFDARPTSLRPEPEFWQYLREIAFVRQVTIAELISVVNRLKGNGIPLASALRIFVAEHYREYATGQQPTLALHARQ
jgi:predicted DNA-binding ribbon-helix-helix protein